MANKNDRLDSKFSVIAAFWKPESPEEVMTGTLTNDEKGLTFVASPKYSVGSYLQTAASIASFFGGEPATRIPVMHGFSSDGICTILNLTLLQKPGLHALDRSIEAESFHAAALVNGLYLNGSDDSVIGSARFTFTGLGQWLPRSFVESWEKDHVLLKIPMSHLTVFDVGVRSTMTHVTLKVMSSFSTPEDDSGRQTRPLAYVDVESSKPESLDWYFGVGIRLENLFSILLGCSVALESVFAHREDESGSLVRRTKRVVGKFDVRDCVRCSDSQLAHAVACWLSQPEEFSAVEDLSLGVLRKSELAYVTEFLSLTQALEGFHRVAFLVPPVDKTVLRKVRRAYATLLSQEDIEQPFAKRICDSMSHANDPTLRSRLTSLCRQLPESTLQRMSIDTASFVTAVSNTRNFYVHAGSKLSSRRGTPLSGSELFFVNQKLRALLRALLLLHVGLPEPQIRELAVRDATKWR